MRSWSGDRYRCPAGCLTRSQRAIDDLVLATIRARLAWPDLADLITPEESEQARQVGERLRGRLARIEDDYDRGDIDGRRYKTAAAKVQAELNGAQRVQARLTVAEVMSRRVPVCSPDDSVAYVMREMTRLRHRHLPVIDGGELVGVVSIGDVVKNRVAEIELETGVLRDAYIGRRV